MATVTVSAWGLGSGRYLIKYCSHIFLACSIAVAFCPSSARKVDSMVLSNVYAAALCSALIGTSSAARFSAEEYSSGQVHHNIMGMKMVL